MASAQVAIGGGGQDEKSVKSGTGEDILTSNVFNTLNKNPSNLFPFQKSQVQIPASPSPFANPQFEQALNFDSSKSHPMSQPSKFESFGLPFRIRVVGDLIFETPKGLDFD